jgi:hypothetical protein
VRAKEEQYASGVWVYTGMASATAPRLLADGQLAGQGAARQRSPRPGRVVRCPHVRVGLLPTVARIHCALRKIFPLS